jgi:transcriptional regulator with XRE-family HTH domain
MRYTSFSDQLRRAIESSGVSRYALAGCAGISDSALRRFLSGERGFTLASLDKLADALGLEIVIGVQKLPRPGRGGRSPTKGVHMIAQTAMTSWSEIAASLAGDAHLDYFSSRRG